ncbi:MAG: hypothetical protein OXH98_06085 [Caldilineaceae bacterium]|nr:hypothetical protein [Caldilineaceae bacterium]
MNLRSILRRRSNSPTHYSLSAPQENLLLAVLSGATLKSHRDVDGTKEYRLHPLDGDSVDVPEQIVRSLEERGLLLSNQKFPAASLILSQSGRRFAQEAREAAGSKPRAVESASTHRR